MIDCPVLGALFNCPYCDFYGFCTLSNPKCDDYSFYMLEEEEDEREDDW